MATPQATEWDVELITSWVSSLLLHDLMESNPVGIERDAFEDLGEIELTIGKRVFRIEVIDMGEVQDHNDDPEDAA